MTNVASRAAEIRDATTTNFNTALRVGQSLLDINNSAGIDPCTPEYGAVGDGVASDNAALLLAITAAIAAGVPVSGRGRTYGITGNLALVANAWIQDATFKQLTPSAGSVRTLTSAGGNNIRLTRVVVNRNGSGSSGAVTSDSGIWLSGGTGHLLTDCEVYGDDMGAGIVMSGCGRFKLVRPYVHDIDYLLGADPGDDRVMGIWVTDCEKFSIVSPVVHDLGGNYGGGATTQWSRGMAFSGGDDFSLIDPLIYNVDQGIDVTGSAGNTRFTFSAGVVMDCRSWGWKFANTARDGTVVGAVAERCGYAGFVVSGPSEDTSGNPSAVKSCSVLFDSCTAYDTASNGVWAANANGAFLVFPQTYNIDFPKGIKFANCRAIDRQAVPTMKYGFKNDVLVGTDGQLNEAVGCTSDGHTVSAFSGMHAARCEVSRVAVQVIGTGSWTGVDWTAEVDLGGMHNNAVNPANVFARRAGTYRSAWGVAFAASAAGQRGVRLLYNGTVVPGTTVLVDAAAAGETALSTSWTTSMLSGDNVRIEVFQSSGGNLNLQTTSGGVVEQVS